MNEPEKKPEPMPPPLIGLNVDRNQLVAKGMDRLFGHDEFLAIFRENMPNFLINVRFHWQQIMTLGFKSGVNLGCGDNAVQFKDPWVNFDLHPELKDKHKLDNFVCGNLYDTKFNDKQFECSVLGDVLEHCTKPNDILKEMRRITSKRMVITVPSVEHDDVCALPGHKNLSEHRFRNILIKTCGMPEEIVDRMEYPEVLENVRKHAPLDITMDHVQKYTSMEQVKELFPTATAVLFVRGPLWMGYLIYEDLK